MTVIKKTIGRLPVLIGEYDSTRSYGKKNRVTLFGSEFESKHDNNNTAPATWDGSETVTFNEVDWQVISNGTSAWIAGNDKPAASEDFPYNGMGRIILEKNMVDIAEEGEEPNIVNLLTQSAFEDSDENPITNTIFVIKYDFTLGEDITVPANCVLEFDGGSISASGNNDTITGNSTGIQAGLVKIFNTDVTLVGTWNVVEAYPEWFGAKGDGVTNDTTAIQKAADIFEGVGGTVKLQSKHYSLYSVELPSGVTLCGNYSRPKGDMMGTVLYCVDSSNPAIKINAGCSVRDISFCNPVNKSTTIVEMPPCIFLNDRAHGCTIENITFINAYIGIAEGVYGITEANIPSTTDNSAHVCLYVNNIDGFCLKYCIDLNKSADCDRIQNIQLNPVFAYRIDEFNNFYDTYKEYVYRYATAIRYRSDCDGGYLTNCFAYGYNLGIYVRNNTFQTTITSCNFDACNNGINVYGGQYDISNCMIFISDPYELSIAGGTAIVSQSVIPYSEVVPNSHDNINNCSIKLASGAALALGHATIVQNTEIIGGSYQTNKVLVYFFNGGSIDNCVFDTKLDPHAIALGATGNSIQKSGFNVKVTNNIFRRAAIHPIYTDGFYGDFSNKFIECTTSLAFSLLKLGISGPLTNKPVNNLFIGQTYFVTDSNNTKPIYWTGTAWVDATGTPV